MESGAGSAEAGARPEAGARVRVATYNIRHGLGTDGVIDLERTAGVIRATGARVVGLQELDRFWARPTMTDPSDQPALLGEATGFTVRFFPALRRGEAEYGLALARPEPFEAASRTLPRLGREEPRIAIVALLEELTIVVTHLSVGAAARAVQTSSLAELASSLPAPVVVMGDLNQERSTLTPLSEAGFVSGEPVATLGRRQIDHIWVGPGLRIVRTWAGARGASDHRPLVAEIERVAP